VGIPRNKFYISANDLTSCPSGVFYKKKKTPLPLVHPRIAEIWQVFGRLQEKGQKIQKMVMEEWQRGNVLVSPERFIPWNDFGITGKYDAIVRINGEFILYEIKGAGKQIFDNELDKPEPFDAHRSQVIIYHYFLRKNFPGIKAKILYVERSGDRRLEITIEYEDKEFLKNLEIVKSFQEALDKDIPQQPKPTIAWNKFQNRYDLSMAAITCKYHALCLKDDKWYEKAVLEVREKNKKEGYE